MSARFRCSNVDTMRAAASPGILVDLNFIFGVALPESCFFCGRPVKFHVFVLFCVFLVI